MNSLFYTSSQFKVFAEDLLDAFINSGFEVIEEPNVDYELCGFRATFVRRYFFHQPLTINEGILTTIVHVVGLPFGLQGQKMVVMSAPRNIDNEPISDSVKLRIHFDHNGMPHVINNGNSGAHGESRECKNQTHLDESTNGSTRGCDQPATSEHDANNESCSSELEANGLIMTTKMHHEVGAGVGESLVLRGAKFLDLDTLFGSRDSNSIRHQYEHDDSQQQIYENFLLGLSRYVAQIIEVISPGIIRLPTDMKLEILKKLSVDSIIKMSQVNNEFRNLIFKHGESLWRHLCYRDFKIKVINRLVHRSWIELYRDTYIIRQAEICRKERALPGLPERPALPPVPYRLPIAWWPVQPLELPFYPIENHDNEAAAAQHGHIEQLALEFRPLRRVDSLESLP